jgi:hypothetical protein
MKPDVSTDFVWEAYMYAAYLYILRATLRDEPGFRARRIDEARCPPSPGTSAPVVAARPWWRRVPGLLARLAARAGRPATMPAGRTGR